MRLAAAAKPWEHEHTFGQDKRMPGERPIIVVLILSLGMMFLEIICGVLFGSMALLADGVHMASHSAAFAISICAYVYARRRASDRSFCFGTGKVNALGGFSGGLVLAVFAAGMVWESGRRLVHPVSIDYGGALIVAVIGLVLNIGSLAVLGRRAEFPEPGFGSRQTGRDENLRAAYFHVVADALTSVLAIAALLLGKYAGAVRLDAVIGAAGALMVIRWSVSLLRGAAAVLLDKQGPTELRRAIREAVERNEGEFVSDLHLWSIGPGIYALSLGIVSGKPRPPGYYKRMLPNDSGIVHTTVEIHKWRSAAEAAGDEAATPPLVHFK